MRKITAIEVQKRTPNRVNIHLDGEFAFGLSRIVAAWLRVGQEVDEEKIKRLQLEEAQERAFQQVGPGLTVACSIGPTLARCYRVALQGRESPVRLPLNCRPKLIW